jgi:uncharacterized protein (TIGR03437 family)
MISKFSFSAKTVRLGLLAGLLTMPVSLFGQAPIITAVVNDASGEAKLSPGVAARIYFTPILSSGSVNVTVGGRYTTGRIPFQAGYADLVLPLDLEFGPTSLTITTKSGTSDPFPVSIDMYAPGLYDVFGHPGDPVALSCPSRPGDFISLNTVGLGPVNPPVAVGGGPPQLTIAKPSVTIGGKPAIVTKSYLAVPYIGGYQVELAAAPDTPEGLQPVVLTIGGRTSNSVNVLIGMHVSSARPMHAAPDSIAYAGGCANPLATGEFASDPNNPPTELGGTTVTVTDAGGVQRLAPIVSVSPTVAQFVVPSETASGSATVTITSGGGSTSTAPLQIETVEPYLYSVACYPWCNAPQGFLVRVRNGVETVEPFIDENHLFIPIDLGPPTDQVYLVMFGTGFRHYSSLDGVSAEVGGVDAAIQYIGPQGQIAGLDEVKVLLPRAMAGASDGVYVLITVDGKTTLDLMLFFR